MKQKPGNLQMDTENIEPIIGILGGPTASGKSAMAVEIAHHHDLAIISADSMQVYRGMEIGTGVIPQEERRGVPHHLIAIADPGEEFHAARFAGEARSIATTEWQIHGRRSLLVGGTGLWIQALREGLMAGPGRDETIRSELRGILEHDGPEALHRELALVDPLVAEKLSPRDHVRVLRAIEVHRLTGRPLSDWYREDEVRRANLGPLLPLVVMTHPRELLHERIDKRVDEMLAAGWLDEAAALLRLNLPDHAPARKALGYRDLFGVLEGKSSLEEATVEIKRSTRQFARRQMTWFKAQRGALILTSPTRHDIELALGLTETSSGA